MKIQKREGEEAAEEIDIDDQTGMQLYINELEDQLTSWKSCSSELPKSENYLNSR